MVNAMIEYLPWSKSVFDNTYSNYLNGHFSIIDVELGGKCNYHCIYCDSPDRKKVFTARADVEKLLSSNNFSWLFICGLGEPAFSSNKGDLVALLNRCKETNTKCSIFTNLSNFDDELFSYVEDEVLYVMFKFDSLTPTRIKKLYGCRDSDIDAYFDRLSHLLSLVKVRKNCTNLCASIVPTTENYAELPALINYCSINQIFPLIGDLEDSGLGKTAYRYLKLSDEQLSIIKSQLLEDYRIPICPSVLSGVHILYDGTVAVDKLSGLSCHWFWLEEPQIHSMKNVKEYSSIKDMENDIFRYRHDRLQFVKSKATSITKKVFGGCGGDIKELLEVYLQMQQNQNFNL